MAEENSIAEVVERLSRGKNEQQKMVIKYFFNHYPGCFESALSDETYMEWVFARRNTIDIKQKALAKLGLDEEQVNEIPPAIFMGYNFKDAYARRKANGDWVSSNYQLSCVFFSSEQIYLYSYVFHMDDDNYEERTDEFFYKDVTSFSTITETETTKSKKENEEIKVSTNKFAIVVPGDKLFMSMDGVQNADSIIQGMKQKLREKKQVA